MSDNSLNLTLSAYSEEKILEAIKPYLTSQPHVELPAGDDCSIINTESSQVLFKTDSIVETRHFEPQSDPQLVGRKALARPLSDIAAMGGTPLSALITLASPPHHQLQYITDIYQGIDKLAKEFNVSLSGGETVSLPEQNSLLISVTLLGKANPKNSPKRSSGKPGDIIFVTGQLGNSYKSQHHFTFTPRIKEGQSLAPYVNSMMDLSDGLGSDLPRLAKASQCGFDLEKTKIPIREEANLQQAITEGEDYELLGTASDENWEQIKNGWDHKFPKTEITAIGQLTEDKSDYPSWLQKGWDHFEQI